MQGFRAVINLIVLHFPLRALFTSDLPFLFPLPSPCPQWKGVTAVPSPGQLCRSLLHLQPGEQPLAGTRGGGSDPSPQQDRAHLPGAAGGATRSIPPFPSPTSGGDAELAGQSQLGDGVLVDEGREAPCNQNCELGGAAAWKSLPRHLHPATVSQGARVLALEPLPGCHCQGSAGRTWGWGVPVLQVCNTFTWPWLVLPGALETAPGAARAAVGNNTVLTKIQLLAGTFQVNPFGGGLDEEVPDEVTALLACRRDHNQHQHRPQCHCVPPAHSRVLSQGITGAALCCQHDASPCEKWNEHPQKSLPALPTHQSPVASHLALVGVVSVKPFKPPLSLHPHTCLRARNLHGQSEGAPE